MKKRKLLSLWLLMCIGQNCIVRSQDGPRDPDGGPDSPQENRPDQGPVGGIGGLGMGGPPGGFGFGGPRGPGGFGGPNRQTMKVVEKFDTNQDGWLNAEERVPARQFVLEQKPQFGRGPGGFGPPGGFGLPGGFGPPEMQPGLPSGEPPLPDGPDSLRPQQPQRPPRDENGNGNSRDGNPAGQPPGSEGRGRGRGGPGMGGRNMPPAQPGKHVEKSDVTPVSGGLYDPNVLRTIFIDFENHDWESELSDFRDTDVEVPATITVDGQAYPLVGIRFRGNTSLQMISNGYKRPLNLSMDLANEDQRLYGYRTLNLLNGVNDPSLMSAALYSHIANQHYPAPKANLVRVVINGEYWGIYSNVQQLNKDFLKEHYQTSKGARWKVPGSPGSQGGLQYFGDDRAMYERLFEAKDASDKDWKQLMAFTKTLNETPVDQLADAIRPLIDIDELLWFLAVDIASVNSDGYWTRGSDYYIWLDEKGKFHFYPYDINEAFVAGHGPGPGGRGGFGPGGGMPPGFGPGQFGPPGFLPPGSVPPGFAPDQPFDIGPDGQRREGQPRDGQARQGRPGPGRGRGGPGGGMGGGGPDLDPLAGLDNDRFPLRSKILAVPEFRQQYVHNIQTLGQSTMQWKNIEPLVSSYRKLIQDELHDDTHKLTSYEDFVRVTGGEAGSAEGERGGSETLQQFFEARSARLIKAGEAPAGRGEQP